MANILRLHFLNFYQFVRFLFYKTKCISIIILYIYIWVKDEIMKTHFSAQN